ncbi:protein FAM200A-like, partial [Aphis craccivora]
AALEDKISNAQTILNTIAAPLNVVYLQFLSFVLPFFIDLNLEMQSEDMKIHVVYDRISSIYKEILSCFIKRIHITNKCCHEINYTNPQLYLSNEDVYIGVKVFATLSTLLSENKIKPILQHFKMIDPKTIHGGKITSLGLIASQLPILFNDIDLDDVDRGWRKLINMDLDEEVVNSN